VAENKSVSDLLLTEVVPFTKGTLMTMVVSEDNMDDAALAYRIIDWVEKLCVARKEALKPSLHAFAEKNGEKLPNGGYAVKAGNGFLVTRERREASDPDPEGVKDLLKAVGIQLEEAFTTIKVLQLDASKVNFLVESGKLDGAAVQKLKKVSYALKVSEPKEAQPLLKSAKA